MSVLPCDQPFSIYKVIESGNAPNILRLALNILQSRVACISYVHIAVSSVGQFCFVSLYYQPFRDTRFFFENQKCTEWPQNDPKHFDVKGTLCILNTYPKAQILVHSAVSPAVCKIQGCSKSEMYRMTSNQLWTLKNENYPVCIKQVPPRSQICVLLINDQTQYNCWICRKSEMYRVTSD